MTAASSGFVTDGRRRGSRSSPVPVSPPSLRSVRWDSLYRRGRPRRIPDRGAPGESALGLARAVSCTVSPTVSRVISYTECSLLDSGSKPGGRDCRYCTAYTYVGSHLWVSTECTTAAPTGPDTFTTSRTGYGREDTQPAEAATGRGVASAQLVAHTRQTRIWPAARWRHRPLAQRHGHRQLGSRNAPRSA